MTQRILALWEILVPAHTPKGKEIDVAHHAKWDEKIVNIAGGLTILKPVKGAWKSEQSGLIKEDVIAVRIACTEQQISKIIDVTMDHYSQKAVMVYKVSDTVIIREKR